MKLPPRVNPYEDTRERQIERILLLEQLYGNLEPFDLSTWSAYDITLYEECLRCDLETRGDFPPGTVDPPVIMHEPKKPELSLNGVVPEEREPAPFTHISISPFSNALPEPME